MKLKGVSRPVYNSYTKQHTSTNWPPTRQEAFAEGVAFYYPAGNPPCPDPGDMSIGIRPHHSGSTSNVYTISDKQVCCAKADARQAYLEAVASGEPAAPGPAAAAVGYYWVHSEGKYCGHVGKRTIDDKCFQCVADRAARPRQVALRTGDIWYMPADGDTCSEGHTARRRVANGSCEECERLRSSVGVESSGAVLPLYKIDPDGIYPYEVAKALGYKHYRTGEPCSKGHRGWRYVSTRNCLDCR